MIKKYGDIISSVVLLVITGIYFSATFDLNTENIGGNALIPRIISAVLGAGCLYILVTSSIDLYRKKSFSEVTGLGNNEKTVKINYTKVLLTLILIAFYALLFPLLGFLVATPIYLTAQIQLLAPKDKRKILPKIVLAVIFTAFIYIIFTHVLILILPTGSIW